MSAQRGKRSEMFSPFVVMRKWLNIKPKLNDFSEDEFDTESEDSDGSYLADGFFGIHEDKYMIGKSLGDKTTAAPLRRLQRRKSESLRVNYISNKDVRVTIGTWNVAGRNPTEDLELEQWLCTQEPADMYVVGFQEVVPLSAGNVLGAEDSRTIPKWEAIIRRTLNKTQQPKAICKSYSAPLSPLVGSVPSSDGHEDTRRKIEDELAKTLASPIGDKQTSRLNGNWFTGTSFLDWPEHPLDFQSEGLILGTGLRRVMSLGLSSTDFAENAQGFDLQDVTLQAGIKRAYHSSGNLGLSWSEQQDKFDVLNSLDYISDRTESEDSPSVGAVQECSTLWKDSSEHSANYVRIVSKQMVGIHVSVWVSRKLRQHVNNLEVASVGVGLLGYMGNKGSISISMSLFQTRLCFVCSHLASGHKCEDQRKRNSDVDEILQRTRFSALSAAGQPQKIPSHDRIFWFEDLNYRIDMPDAEIRDLIAMTRWDDLLKSDQLTKELMSGSTFVGWKEGLINFPPTYKYEVNSSRYVGEIRRDGGKRRSPA